MGMVSVKEDWEKIKEKLKETVSESTFVPWIMPLEAQNFDGEVLTLASGQPLAIHILRKNNSAQIINAISEYYKKNVTFNIVFDEVLSKKIRKKTVKTAQEIKTEKFDNLKQMHSGTNLNLKYKFENFVVGENSKLAYAESEMVSKNLGKKYNPLFIYGGSELGKTHLMQSIGHYCISNYNNIKVLYVKTEDFVNDYINSLFNEGVKGNKITKMENFRQKYRNLDVLLIDDIQFLEGKQQTETEIFNTFEHLYNSNKQIVIASDRLPEAIPNLSDRLRTRFEMGLMADIQAPDYETRIAILKNLALMNSFELSNEILEFLASVYKQNIRELEGVFNRITAYSTIYEKKLDLDLVKKIINYSENKTTTSTEGIIYAVAEFFNVSYDEITGVSRQQKIANARQIAIYLAREITKESFNDIADAFFKKHTTIMYSYDKVKEDMKTDKKLSQIIAEIKEKIS